MSTNEYVFRHAGGCVIDFPDITVDNPPAWQPWRWIATVWPDQYRPDGWAAFEWAQGERGWILPDTLAVGDVIEFGLAWFDASGQCVCVHRWFGWMPYATHYALVVTGPFEDPRLAFAEARSAIDEIRLEQLVGPAVPVGLDPEWDRAADEA